MKSVWIDDCMDRNRGEKCKVGPDIRHFIDESLLTCASQTLTSFLLNLKLDKQTIALGCFDTHYVEYSRLKVLPTVFKHAHCMHTLTNVNIFSARGSELVAHSVTNC
jgi:hypothetical protein